jgi:D-inositol-3-phosphate glycosyltransferase
VTALAPPGGAARAGSAPPLTVIAAVHPLTGGAAPFNGAMVQGLRRLGPVDLVSWRRLYPPLLHRGQAIDAVSRPPDAPDAAFLLDWADPRTWRRALARVTDFGARALVVPWLHPVMAPPYRALLRHAPRGVTRVVVCHNVVPHERVPAGAALTRAVLRHADLLVTHAPHQRGELTRMGLGDTPVVEAFHPRFEASALARTPSAAAVAAERRRQGNPDLSLLAFGAVRPYKGVDLALEALVHVDPWLRVRLVVAGRFWEGVERYRRLVDRLGLGNRVELRDEYVSNDDAALLFLAADAAVLPYRSASQSGVAQLALAYGRPVIATRVGGLPAAVADGVDGVLCRPEDPRALADAIERLARERDALAAGAVGAREATSFARYAELLHDGLERVAA